MDDSNLIFIVSQPRSGSTLLQKIVSNTSFINTVSEPWVLLPFISALRTDIQNAAYDSELAAEVIGDYLKKFDLQKILIQEQKKFLLNFYKPLLNNDTLYVLDKTPRYYEILNELTKYFPNAKIVILIRNPLDVLQSIIQTWKVKSLRGLDYYARDILLAPVLLDKFYSTQANNKNVRRLYYEDLIENAEQEIKSLFEWLKIPFSNGILDFDKNAKTSGKRGDRVGINRYKNIATKAEKNINSNAYMKVWKPFVSGYINYLKSSSLKSYSKYNFNNGRKTATFNYYLKINNAEKKRRRVNIIDVITFVKTKLFLKENLKGKAI